MQWRSPDGSAIQPLHEREVCQIGSELTAQPGGLYGSENVLATDLQELCISLEGCMALPPVKLACAASSHARPYDTLPGVMHFVELAVGVVQVQLNGPAGPG